MEGLRKVLQLPIILACIFHVEKLTNVSENPSAFKALPRILTDKEKRFHSKTHIKNPY